MLVLSRRVRDTICFPELDINLEILQIKNARIRLGVKAPIEITVPRGELDRNAFGLPEKKKLVSVAEDQRIRSRLETLTEASRAARDLISKGFPELAALKLTEALGDEALATKVLSAIA